MDDIRIQERTMVVRILNVAEGDMESLEAEVEAALNKELYQVFVSWAPVDE